MKNYFKNCNKNVLKVIQKIGRVADKQGLSAYVVGGIVRDILLKRDHLDVDIVIEGDAILFARVLEKKFKVKFTCYSQFKTASAVLAKGLQIDLATARKEHYSSPGALPIVLQGGVKEDLFRRDFTINAMAISINLTRFGQLVDYWGGLKDLERKKIRILHDQSFADDPTRILRAVRFEQRFDFKMERKTLSLLKQALALQYPILVKPPRYFAEFRNLLNEDNPVKGLQRLKQLKGFEFIAVTFNINSRHLGKIHLQHKLCPIELRSFVYFLCLIDTLESEKLQDIAKRFSFTRNERKSILQILEISGIIKSLKKAHLRPSQVYQMLQPLTEEVVWYLRGIMRNQLSCRYIDHFLNVDRRLATRMTGEDLKGLGVISGKKMGIILKTLLYQKMDGAIRTKRDEMRIVKAMKK